MFQRKTATTRKYILTYYTSLLSKSLIRVLDTLAKVPEKPATTHGVRRIRVTLPPDPLNNLRVMIRHHHSLFKGLVNLPVEDSEKISFYGCHKNLKSPKVATKGGIKSRPCAILK